MLEEKTEKIRNALFSLSYDFMNMLIPLESASNDNP